MRSLFVVRKGCGDSRAAAIRRVGFVVEVEEHGQVAMRPAEPRRF
jgi:hypothetical protein